MPIYDRIKPGSFTFDELYGLAERVGDHQDIGKQDSRIKAKASDRLQGYFRGKLRRKTERQKAPGLFAHCPILRQVATRLSHQPDRRWLSYLMSQDIENRLVHRAIPARPLLLKLILKTPVSVFMSVDLTHTS
jgi:hypothetical protein